MNTTATPNCDDFLSSSLTASGEYAPAALPTAHFEPFSSNKALPLTVTDDGMVFGHIAPNDVCHVGLPDCITMPKSAASLSYFHTGQVRLDDGSDLATGKITMKGGHADLSLGYTAAMAHYDDVTTCVADVVAWEDDFGIAVTGHVRSGLDPAILHAFRASTPSGDWRKIGYAAELINIHMVNSPGFPIYREENGNLMASIVASGVPVRNESSSSTAPYNIEREVDAALALREVYSELDDHANFALDNIGLDE